MIYTDIPAAKAEKVHPTRRTERSEQFKPVDGDSQYATLNAEGEALRVSIKAIDDQLQTDIDAAETEEELKAVYESIDVAYGS